MINLVIFGGPGSGKGTQSDLLIKRLGLSHLSTGELLRAEIASGSALGKLVDSYISKGNLVPDALIINILDNKIDTLLEGKGMILDGFPRTVEQANALREMLARRSTEVNFLIDLDVPREILIDRLLKRGQMSGRSDDNLETIQHRLEVYTKQTAPLLELYKRKNKYLHIDGSGSIEEIYQRIVSHLAL